MRRTLLAAVAAMLVGIGSAAAQVYPSRPITIVVPFPAGGPADVVVRIMLDRMKASLGQPVIVENQAGANGSIGAGRVARAAPDGYTISFGPWNTHVANGAAYNLGYDVVGDFEPVAAISSYAQLIVGKQTIPADDLKGLIAWLKTNPGKVSQGHPGVSSQGHLAGIFFQAKTGTSFQHVPYRGNAIAIQDLVAGQIDLMFPDPVTALPQAQAGKIKVFAVAGATRSPQAPNIPTVDEAGLPGFYVTNWNALWAPKGTAPDVVAKLNAAVMETLADADVRAKLATVAQEIYPREQQSPQALRALQKADIERWWPIIKAANIKTD